MSPVSVYIYNKRYKLYINEKLDTLKYLQIF